MLVSLYALIKQTGMRHGRAGSCLLAACYWACGKEGWGATWRTCWTSVVPSPPPPAPLVPLRPPPQVLYRLNLAERLKAPWRRPGKRPDPVQVGLGGRGCRARGGARVEEEPYVCLRDAVRLVRCRGSACLGEGATGERDRALNWESPHAGGFWGRGRGRRGLRRRPARNAAAKARSAGERRVAVFCVFTLRLCCLGSSERYGRAPSNGLRGVHGLPLQGKVAERHAVGYFQPKCVHPAPASPP